MGVGNSTGQLLHQGGGVERRRRPIRLAEDLTETAALNIFQGEVGSALVLTDLVDLDDVGVL
jgi:hypothetical protein